MIFLRFIHRCDLTWRFMRCIFDTCRRWSISSDFFFQQYWNLYLVQLQHYALGSWITQHSLLVSIFNSQKMTWLFSIFNVELVSQRKNGFFLRSNVFSSTHSIFSQCDCNLQSFQWSLAFRSFSLILSSLICSFFRNRLLFIGARLAVMPWYLSELFYNY